MIPKIIQVLGSNVIVDSNASLSIAKGHVIDNNNKFLVSNVSLFCLRAVKSDSCNLELVLNYGNPLAMNYYFNAFIRSQHWEIQTCKC